MAHARLAVPAVTIVTACLGCAPRQSSFERAGDAARMHDWDVAVTYYERALSDQPDNVEYRLVFVRARLAASRAHLADARACVDTGELETAIDEFEIALSYDPTNRYARDELDELRMRATRVGASESSARVSRWSPFVDGQPALDAGSPEPLHVKFPEGSSLRTVLETLAELAGVGILFDEAFRDQRVVVDIDGVSYREALDILMQTHGLFYKVVSSSTVLVTTEK